MGYEYITDNNLYNKQNYMYSQFKGIKFFSEYIKSREIAEPENNLCIYDEKDKSKTYKEIHHILNNLDNYKESQLWKLDKYVKSFEIRKRLYTIYDNWKPLEGSSFENYDIYLIFAQALAKAYELSDCLKYFSCLLKVDDTLLSVQDKLNKKQIKLLQSITRQEIKYFKDLYKKNGLEGEDFL